MIKNKLGVLLAAAAATSGYDMRGVSSPPATDQPVGDGERCRCGEALRVRRLYQSGERFCYCRKCGRIYDVGRYGQGKWRPVERAAEQPAKRRRLESFSG